MFKNVQGSAKNILSNFNTVVPSPFSRQHYVLAWGVCYKYWVGSWQEVQTYHKSVSATHLLSLCCLVGKKTGRWTLSHSVCDLAVSKCARFLWNVGKFACVYVHAWMCLHVCLKADTWHRPLLAAISAQHQSKPVASFGGKELFCWRHGGVTRAPEALLTARKSMLGGSDVPADSSVAVTTPVCSYWST